MKIIYKARWAGKTTELIKISSKTGKYILCLDEAHKKNILYIADKLKLNIPHPITLFEIKKWSYRWSSVMRDGILVDDWWVMLQHLIGIPIETLTICRQN